MLTTLALYLTLGAGAGIVAGLFGIGGGLTIVPVLVITFQLQGMSEAVLTHMAVATSLATIVVTSISSIRAHHQRGAVRWELVKPLGAGIILGAVLGVNTSVQLPGPVLQLILGIFVLLVTLQMLLNIKPSAGSKPPSTPELATAGVGIGWVSAIFGIGGGTLMVPYLNWRRVVMQQAVATSAACGLPIALMGALTNIWLGWGEDELPEWSLGYVYLPAFIGIVLASYLTAPIGARWAHSLPQAKLKKIFALFLLAASIYFIINYFY
jgi:uncharacterized membrane protein YfcA